MQTNASQQHTPGVHPMTWMAQYSRRQQFKRMARTLLAEKDEILSDLGYERWELIVALSLPLRSDALSYLEQRRQSRR
nr:hypothetical protein [uncultured Marinobacter sp.]